MPGRDDFTDDEWRTLRDLPWQVGIATIAADPSGPLATGRELRAVADFVATTDAHGHRSEVIRLVADDLAADHDFDRLPAGDAEFRALPARALEAAREARALLVDTAGGVEADAYGRWVAALAGSVAAAAREGLLGLVGRRVSDAEEQWLGDLEVALGLE